MVRLRRLLRAGYGFLRHPQPALVERLRGNRGIQDAKNQLGIVIGLSELLLADLESGDARRRDVEEIRTAGLKAVVMLDALAASTTTPQAATTRTGRQR